MQDFGFADSACERLKQPFVVNQSDRVAWVQAVEILSNARQASDVREIGQAQFELSEDPIERIVTADDELDRVAQRLRDRIRLRFRRFERGELRQRDRRCRNRGRRGGRFLPEGIHEETAD